MSRPELIAAESARRHDGARQRKQQRARAIAAVGVFQDLDSCDLADAAGEELPAQSSKEAKAGAIYAANEPLFKETQAPVLLTESPPALLPQPQSTEHEDPPPELPAPASGLAPDFIQDIDAQTWPAPIPEEEVVPYFSPAPQAMEREEAMEAVGQSKCQTREEAKAWARRWWNSYTPKPHGSELYFGAERLFELLEPRADGTPAPVRLLRGSWLLKLAAKLRACRTDDERARLRLPRRQELPEAAFLSAAEARTLPRGHAGVGGGRKPLKACSISHGEADDS